MVKLLSKILDVDDQNDRKCNVPIYEIRAVVEVIFLFYFLKSSINK